MFFLLFSILSGGIPRRYEKYNISFKGGGEVILKGKGWVPPQKQEVPIAGAVASGSTPNAAVPGKDQQNEKGDPGLGRKVTSDEHFWNYINRIAN